MLWLCGRTQKLCGGKATTTLLKLMLSFNVTVLNRQWINDYLNQTARFANCED